MTTLEAVNKILRTIGEPKASALDTGGTSIEAEAEEYLDDANADVQRRGWMTNTTRAYELELATKKIVVSGGSGTFLYDELVTETTSGATGWFKAIDSNNEMHIVVESGTFAGSLTLTGGTSGATRTGGTLTTVTENLMFVNSVWLKIAPAKKETRTLVVRGDYIYDETNQTAAFSASMFLDVTRELYFTDLPNALAEYVARKAALDFEWYKKGENSRAAMERYMEAKAAAFKEDGDLHRANILTTAHSLDVKGRRRVYA